MAKKEEKIDLSRRNFLMGFRKAKEKDPEEVRAPQASTDETFDVLKEANLAFKDENWEEARDKYRAFLKKESRNPDARYRLARCFYHLGKFTQAKVDFERTLQNRRDDQEALLWLGLTLMRLDRAPKAVGVWKRYFKPEAMDVQREVNISLAFLETEDENCPEPNEMADRVEAAWAEYREEQMA